jgi:hypothetical protein
LTGQGDDAPLKLHEDIQMELKRLITNAQSSLLLENILDEQLTLEPLDPSEPIQFVFNSQQQSEQSGEKLHRSRKKRRIESCRTIQKLTKCPVGLERFMESLENFLLPFNTYRKPVCWSVITNTEETMDQNHHIDYDELLGFQCSPNYLPLSLIFPLNEKVSLGTLDGNIDIPVRSCLMMTGDFVHYGLGGLMPPRVHVYIPTRSHGVPQNSTGFINVERYRSTKLLVQDGSPKILKSKKFRGLKNHGASCYLNVMMQCIFRIHPLMNLLYRFDDQLNRNSLISLCVQLSRDQNFTWDDYQEMVIQIFSPDDLMERLMPQLVFDSSPSRPASDILKDQSYHNSVIERVQNTYYNTLIIRGRTSLQLHRNEEQFKMVSDEDLTLEGERVTYEINYPHKNYDPSKAQAYTMQAIQESIKSVNLWKEQLERQQDFHEAFVKLLDRFQMISNYFYTRGSQNIQFEPEFEELFRLRIKQYRVCHTCQSSIEMKSDSIMNLQIPLLPLPRRGPNSVHLVNLLTEYLLEQMSDWNGDCECSPPNIWRQAYLDRLPKVLFVSFKRTFVVETRPGKLQNKKSKRSVKFSGNLDLRHYLHPERASLLQTNYWLSGIILHSGGEANSGHYTCYVRDSDNQDSDNQDSDNQDSDNQDSDNQSSWIYYDDEEQSNSTLRETNNTISLPLEKGIVVAGLVYQMAELTSETIV